MRSHNGLTPRAFRQNDFFSTYAEGESNTPAGVTREEVEAIAAAKGRVVRRPATDELFIDIDSEEAFATFLRLFAIYLRINPASDYDAAPSPSGKPGHWHVVVRTRIALSPKQRILLQALLGSDPIREMLALEKLLAGADEECLSVFFETPGGAL